MRLEAKHPRVIRYTHWVNAPVLFLMIWSGLLIYWAHDAHEIAIGDTVVFHFFPEAFYSALGLGGRLAEGMAWHFALMWVFLVNGLVYVGYTAFSGEWRFLLPNRRTPREAWHVILHDLGIRKEPLPITKFNAAQRLAYTGIILMGAGSVVTGLAIYKPTQLAWLATICGGYPRARTIHFALTVGYVAFFVVHIAQVFRAGWNPFRAMVIGVELTGEREQNHVAVG